MDSLTELTPDIKISINQIFGIDTKMKVDGFSKKKNLFMLIKIGNCVKRIEMLLELWT